MVVYDTGSDWLTVKSCMTEDHCNKVLDTEATQAKIQAVAKGLKVKMDNKSKNKKE